jgi:hypothetical protein
MTISTHRGFQVWPGLNVANFAVIRLPEGEGDGYLLFAPRNKSAIYFFGLRSKSSFRASVALWNVRGGSAAGVRSVDLRFRAQSIRNFTFWTQRLHMALEPYRTPAFPHLRQP